MHRQADIFYTNQTFCREVLRVTHRRSTVFIVTTSVRLRSRKQLHVSTAERRDLDSLSRKTDAGCHRATSSQPRARRSSLACPWSTTFCSNTIATKDNSTVRACVFASQRAKRLPAHLGEEWERKFGVQLLDGIGSTEMLHMFMSNHENDVRYGSSGKLLQGYEARLVDENGEPTPDDVEGNLWIKGDSAALDYWERPDADDANVCRRLGAHRRSVSSRPRRLLVSHGPQRRLFQVERAMGFAGGGRRRAVAAPGRRRARRWWRISTRMDCRARVRLSSAQDVESDPVDLKSTARVVRVRRCRDSNSRGGTCLSTSCRTRRPGKIQRFKLRQSAEEQRTRMNKSIQETFAPNLACFGCGPANPKGLAHRQFSRRRRGRRRVAAEQ